MDAQLTESRAILDSLLEKISDAYGTKPDEIQLGDGSVWWEASYWIKELYSYYKKWEQIEEFLKIAGEEQTPMFSSEQFAKAWIDAAQEFTNYDIRSVTNDSVIDGAHHPAFKCYAYKHVEHDKLSYWMHFQRLLDFFLYLKEDYHSAASWLKFQSFFDRHVKMLRSLNKPLVTNISYDAECVTPDLDKIKARHQEDQHIQNKIHLDEMNLLQKAIDYELQMLNVEQNKLIHIQERWEKIQKIQSKLNK